MAKINLDFNFFFFGWATNWAQSLNEACGSGGDGSGPRKKKKLA